MASERGDAPAHVDLEDLSFDEYDDVLNPRPSDTDFDDVVARATSRRGLIRSVLAFGSVAAIGGGTALRPAFASDDRFGFKSVSANTKDTITLPEGFNWHVVARWGDPIFPDEPEFDHVTRGTAASQARSFGDNNDGMSVFADSGGRHILIANNEYTNRAVLWGNKPDRTYATEDDIAKGMNAHGLTIAEIAKSEGIWQIVRGSAFNRRITPNTPMKITGPARGHALMKTSDDPGGETVLGTFNNCGNGRTPWGTYLTCEENFNGYFGTTEPDFYDADREKSRYAVKGRDRGYGWWRIDARFDVEREPNECHRHGYVTEVDPLDPDSVPKKRTALGRFKHENAEVVVNRDGRIVVYLGDDERGEFLYRYVSDSIYEAGADPDDLMENGTLFAAHFSPDGTGEWRALTREATGMSAAEICIFTRIAASKVGATTMDRPEWVAANPLKDEVYCALTNNRQRGIKSNAGGDPMPAEGPNPRVANHYGQIVRWRPEDGDHASERFSWDLFLLAGNPTVHADAFAGSDNLTKDNMFNAPDGLHFDSLGRIWIQTDGNSSNRGDFEGHGNNQMLIGDPDTGEIRRFLVGPRDAEITGLAWSADRRTVFVGIQHPGAGGGSDWPDGGGLTPRSAIIAVQRDDRGVLG